MSKSHIWVAYIIVVLLVLLIQPITDLLIASRLLTSIIFTLILQLSLLLLLHKEFASFAITSIDHLSSGAFYSQSPSSFAYGPALIFHQNYESLSSLLNREYLDRDEWVAAISGHFLITSFLLYSIIL